ncbi:MAG: tetratricopeptide repeat protein [Candidatus Acidiferrales bacterium]
MGRHTLRWAALMLVFAGQVSAQHEVAQRELNRPAHPVSAGIQILLPDGAKPGSRLTVLLHSDDGRYNETLFTTRNGWLLARSLEEGTPLVLTVAGEEGIFQTTSVRFAAFEGQMTVHLRAWPGAKVTVSAASLYEADGKARKLCDAAAKDLKKSRFEQAEKKLREAAAIDGRYTRPLIVLGRLRLHQERHDEAAAFFEQALAIDAESPHALAGLGIAHLGRGEYGQAVTLLQRAGQRSSNADVEYHLGLALLESGRWDEAEPVLARVAAGNNQHSALADFVLGQIYQRRGDHARGLVSFESFLRSRPKGPEAALAREMIRELRSSRGHPR